MRTDAVRGEKHYLKKHSILSSQRSKFMGISTHALTRQGINAPVGKFL
jgi:hypothetical protein